MRERGVSCHRWSAPRLLRRSSKRFWPAHQRRRPAPSPPRISGAELLFLAPAGPRLLSDESRKRQGWIEKPRRARAGLHRAEMESGSALRPTCPCGPCHEFTQMHWLSPACPPAEWRLSFHIAADVASATTGSSTQIEEQQCSPCSSYPPELFTSACMN